MTSNPRSALQTETTPEGEQTLVPGVHPLTLKDRLARLSAAPLTPRCQQKPCDVGLFDMDARNQLDLIDVLRATSGGAHSTNKFKE